jgi:hypothetical protein
LWSNLTRQIASEEFKKQAVGWLSGAVQVPCVFISRFL